MKELGMTLLGVLAIGIFFVAKVYPNLEYTGYSSNSSCTGQCYVDYVALNGTAVEIEQRKQALANLDEFSDIRSLWSGCAACHGQEGQGMAVFPALAEREGHELTYKMLDEDFDRETLMETFPGARTFPQIIVDDEKIGGFTEFKALVEASK